jgi:hypothetical protein
MYNECFGQICGELAKRKGARHERWQLIGTGVSQYASPPYVTNGTNVIRGTSTLPYVHTQSGESLNMYNKI